MAYVKIDESRSRPHLDWDRIVYRTVFSALFVPSLGLIALGRAFHRVDSGTAHGSIFAEARTSAHTAAGFALQQ